jgi:mannose-1-phosphate guanylyltransferase
MLHVLIMAGGRGTRFWPASRQLTPKQLLPIVGSQPMLTQTIDRFSGMVDLSEIMVATNKEQVDIVKACAGAVPVVVATAAGAALASLRFLRSASKSAFALPDL